MPDELRWLVDFDRAVADGLGFRVALDETHPRAASTGCSCVGLRMSADAQAGQAELEALFDHHRLGSAGFGLVAQGTPTNNTERVPAGVRRGDDPDATWRDPFAAPATPAIGADPRERPDGEWLATWLGVDPAATDRLPGAAGTDQREAARWRPRCGPRRSGTCSTP